MSQHDRDKWNARYKQHSGGPLTPPPWLVEQAQRLPAEGAALDLAGGLGAAALWLAERGLEATLADISGEALRRAEQAAQSRGLPLVTLEIDLETAPFPPGPWDVVVLTNYLQRSLLPAIAQSLRPGGWFFFSQPTAANLQRHPKPPRAFLLEDGELPSLIEPLPLEIVQYAEGWLDEVCRHGHQGPNGKRQLHTARLAARRPAG